MAVKVSVIGEYNGAQIDRAISQLNRLKTTVDKNSGGIRGAFSKVGSALSSTAGRIGSAIAGSGLLLWLKGSADAAKQAEVTQTRLRTSVKAAGGDWARLAPQIDRAVAAESAFSGFTKGELKSALADLVQRTGSVSKAQSLMGVAMDVARAKGIPVADSARKIGLILAGNTRVLKEFGIEAVKPNTKGLTAHQKALQLTALRMGYVAQIQKRAAGQAAAYGNTSAGAQDKFNAALKGLQVTIGTQILPYINRFLVVLSGLIGKFSSMPKATRGVVLGVLAIGAAALIANASFGPIGIALVAVAAVGLLIYNNWGKIAPVIAKVGAFFKPIADIARQVWTVVQPILARLYAIVKDSVLKAFDNLKQAWANLQPAIKPLLPFLKQLGIVLLVMLVAPIAVVIAAVVATIVVFAKIVQAITWVIKTVTGFRAIVVNAFMACYKHSYLFQHIVDFIASTWAKLKAATLRIWNSLVSTVGSAVSKITKPVTDMLAKASGWGSSVISGLVSGISGGLKAIWNAGVSLANKLKDAVIQVLGIHSPSRVFAELGGHVVGGFVKGLNFKNALAIVKNTFGGLWKFAGGVPSIVSKIFDSGDVGVIQNLIKHVGSSIGGIGSVGKGLAEAMSMVGKPYVWGAMSQAAADCSGLVSLVLGAMFGMGRYGRLTTATIPGALAKGRGKEVSVGLVPGHHTGIEFFNRLAFEAKGKAYGILGPGRARTVWPEWFHPKGFMRGGISTGPGSGYMALLHGTEAIIPLAARFRAQALGTIAQILTGFGGGGSLSLAGAGGGGGNITISPGAVQLHVTTGPGCTLVDATRAGKAAAHALLEEVLRDRKAR